MSDKKELQDSIKGITNKLLELKNYLDSDKKANEIFNKLLIERAIIKKQLAELVENKFAKMLLGKTKKETLICDYFKAN